MGTLNNKQRGISFFGFIWIAVGLVFVAILGMKMVPAYVHSAQIGSILKTIAADPAMQTGSIKEIKNPIANVPASITSPIITAEDLEIVKDNNMSDFERELFCEDPTRRQHHACCLNFNPSSSLNSFDEARGTV